MKSGDAAVCADDLRFAKLYAGELPAIRLLILQGSTQELPENYPPVGVYTMTSADFVGIVHTMIPETGGGPPSTLADRRARMIAWLDDSHGDSVEGRWFRLSDPVHAWLLRTKPEAIDVDGIIS